MGILAFPCLSALPILAWHEKHLVASKGRLTKHSGQRLTRRSIFSAFSSVFSFFLRLNGTFHKGLSGIPQAWDSRQSGLALKVGGDFYFTVVA